MCFGATFPVTKQVLGDTGAYAVVSIRFLAGAAVLAPWARRRPPAPGERRAALWCSAALLAGYVLVTVGLQSTTSTAAAFITYLLVVIVPVLSAVLLRRLPSIPVIAGVALATAGLVLLAGGSFRLGRGELLTLGCAFAFAVHILLLDAFAPRLDVVRFTAIQLLVVGAGAALPALARGEFAELSAGAWAACLFLAGAGVGGLLLQIWGQRLVGPSRTSLLLMLEPVIAAVGGAFLGERVGIPGLAGAALILLGIVVSEIPSLDPMVRRDG